MWWWRGETSMVLFMGSLLLYINFVSYIHILHVSHEHTQSLGQNTMDYIKLTHIMDRVQSLSRMHRYLLCTHTHTHAHTDTRSFTSWFLENIRTKCERRVIINKATQWPFSLLGLWKTQTRATKNNKRKAWFTLEYMFFSHFLLLMASKRQELVCYWAYFTTLNGLEIILFMYPSIRIDIKKLHV